MVRDSHCACGPELPSIRSTDRSDALNAFGIVCLETLTEKKRGRSLCRCNFSSPWSANPCRQTALLLSATRSSSRVAEPLIARVFRLRDWEIAQPIIASYFPGGVIPAPIAVEVSRLTAKQGVRIEPDLWAAVPVDR